MMEIKNVEWSLMERRGNIAVRHSIVLDHEIRLQCLPVPSHFNTKWLGEIFNETGRRIVSLKFEEMQAAKEYLVNRVGEISL